jgi:hypothetical protein
MSRPPKPVRDEKKPIFVQVKVTIGASTHGCAPASRSRIAIGSGVYRTAFVAERHETVKTCENRWKTKDFVSPVVVHAFLHPR